MTGILSSSLTSCVFWGDMCCDSVRILCISDGGRWGLEVEELSNDCNVSTDDWIVDVEDAVDEDEEEG
jgi:hypothetical protein